MKVLSSTFFDYHRTIHKADVVNNNVPRENVDFLRRHWRAGGGLNIFHIGFGHKSQAVGV